MNKFETIKNYVYDVACGKNYTPHYTPDQKIEAAKVYALLTIAEKVSNLESLTITKTLET